MDRSIQAPAPTGGEISDQECQRKMDNRMWSRWPHFYQLCPSSAPRDVRRIAAITPQFPPLPPAPGANVAI